MMKPQKTQCIKHIFEFYTGSRKGVASVGALYQGTAVCVRSDRISSSFHKETKSLKGQNKDRSCACNAVH